VRRKRFELDGALAEACSANENPINRLHARKLDGTHKGMRCDRKREKRERLLALPKERKRENEESEEACARWQWAVGGEDHGTNLRFFIVDRKRRDKVLTNSAFRENGSVDSSAIGRNVHADGLGSDQLDG